MRFAHLGARQFGPAPQFDYLAQKNAAAFRDRSRRADAAVSATPGADAVLQVFSQFRTDGGAGVPTFMLVDYTMRLALEHWPAWAWFPTEEARRRWLALERRAYRAAVRVFAMSETVRHSLVDDYGLDPSRVVVIGSAPSVDAASIRRDPQPGLLLMNASDFRRKGGDVAVAALPLIRSHHPDVRLVLVGGRRRVAAAGVEDVGVVDADRMRTLLARADLVLAPARCDPFPTFLIEAQQAGVPVVASRRDGMPEIVQDGVTGRLVDDLTPAALAAGVVGVLGDRAALLAMGRAARRRAGTYFSWPIIAERVRSEITATLDARPNGIV